MQRATYCLSGSFILRGIFAVLHNFSNQLPRFLQLTCKTVLPIQRKTQIQRIEILFSEMMNVLALGLVLTSLVTAGFFTPSPETEKPRDDVIVKEGRRVVVVEYEKDDGNTKVSISPQDSDQTLRDVDEKKGFASKAFDKLSERTEDVKEGIKEGASSVESQVEGIHHGFRPRELVCDAYGKCKHKIASAIGKTTEAVAGKAHEAAEKVSEVEEGAKEAVGEAIGKVKDTVAHTAHKASDKVQEAMENVKEPASKATGEAKAKVSEKASELKDKAARKMEGAKEMASEKAKEAEERVENASDRAKKGAKRVKREGQKELREILHHAGEVVVDVSDYLVSQLAAFTGVLHLMGFAAAYGICVWVTFASSHVLAGALPRQQFAMVQSKIYPVYFKAMGYSVGLALLGHLISPRKRVSQTSVGMFQGIDLMASLAMILVNLLYLEPRATKVMHERIKKEKEEGNRKESHATEASGRSPDSTAEAVGRGSTVAMTGRATQEKQEAATNSQIIQLSETLQRLNTYSSFLNVMTLASLTWHLVHLGRRLHAAC